MHFHSASSPVSVTYIAPCISQTLWQMITWPKNDFLLLQGYLCCPVVHSCCFELKENLKSTKNTCNMYDFFDVSTDLCRNVSRGAMWEMHTPMQTHTHTLCWQCVLWVPGSSRGLSCCLDIWLLRQIWLIWDGQESSITAQDRLLQDNPTGPTSPAHYDRPPSSTAQLKTDQLSGIQMV